MTDANPSGPEPRPQSTQDAWREVGRQFQDLGDSLSHAFRTAWQDEANRQRVEEMRNGVEAMVNQIAKALRDYSQTPEGQQVRTEAKNAAENLRTASEQTVTEVRPHLVAALRQVNTELQHMINNMDKSSGPGPGNPGTGGDDTAAGI